MANHKSALKRARQNEKRRLRKRAGNATLKTAIKKFEGAMQDDGADKAAELKDVTSALATAAKKGIIPRGRASRKIARLSKALNRAG